MLSTAQFPNPFGQDLIIMSRGTTITVRVTDRVAVGGWGGGQWFRWVKSERDDFLVDYSDGVFGGFALYGSNESNELFTSMQDHQPHYRYCTVGFGGWMLSLRNYELYTYSSRQSGPLELIDYQPNDPLFISLNGKLTVEDEWDLSGDSRAPNDWAVGYVACDTTATGYLTCRIAI